MAYRVDDSREGIIVFQLVNALSKLEVTRLVTDLEKCITKGKVKIILDFSKEAATGAQGLGYIQKVLVRLKGIAQRMQGDILYVLPQKIAERLEGTWGDLTYAVQVLTAGISTDEKQRDLDLYKTQITELQAKVATLTASIQILAKKNKELVLLLGEPQTLEEMQAAVDHYRKLASSVQAASPASRGSGTTSSR